MASDRAVRLSQRLGRGLYKSQEIFNSLTPNQWVIPIFKEPDSWSARELVAHFIYSEESLLMIAKDITTGGEGSPEGMDIDAFNREEMKRMGDLDVNRLMASLTEARAATIEWVRGLDDRILDLEGRHPVLGIVNVETVIYSIYAHQLLHMREVRSSLKDA